MTKTFPSEGVLSKKSSHKIQCRRKLEDSLEILLIRDVAVYVALRFYYGWPRRSAAAYGMCLLLFVAYFFVSGDCLIVEGESRQDVMSIVADCRFINYSF